MKTSYKKVLAMASVVMLTASCSGGSGDQNDGSPKRTCSSFTYQEDAQDYYNANNPGAGRLDADNDGIACEALANRPPTPREDSPSPTPTASSAQGQWTGTTSTLRTFTTTILNDDSYWTVYSEINSPNTIAGMTQGQGLSLNGSYSSSNGKNFKFDLATVHDSVISASYTPKIFFNGLWTESATGSNTFSSTTFSGSYNTTFDLLPALPLIVGNYTGEALLLSESEPAAFTVNPSGTFNGTMASGCGFSGIATPHTSGNIFNLSVTFFSGGMCSNGTMTLTGIAYFVTSTQRLYGLAVNTSRTVAMIFSGTKVLP